jgi:lipopolysaccharide transport system ATP-binding protein
MSDTAIRLDKVSKYYEIAALRERPTNIREAISHAARRAIRRGLAPRRASAPLWALRDVSLEIKRGEMVGVIGGNGAGKSTLLKILSRIIQPTSGRAIIHGRVGSLLEVGTGFHPELTGRENIFLNGAILGMTRNEIRRRFDEIVAFSGVARFLDTPVKRYSSGMQVRLAFAVAAHLDPDVLLVDEVLAVGDTEFQRKCLGKMSDIASSGRTLVFVSHNMAAIQQFTTTAILLRDGRVVAQGPTSAVVAEYLDSVAGGPTAVYDPTRVSRPHALPPRHVEFLSVELEDCVGSSVGTDQDITLRLTVRANGHPGSHRFSFTLFTGDDRPVGVGLGPELPPIPAGEVATYRMTLSDLRLAPGTYYFAIAVGSGSRPETYVPFDVLDRVLKFEAVPNHSSDGWQQRWQAVWGPIRFGEPSVERLA